MRPIDYALAAGRLRPGFGHPLGAGAMVGVFAAIAAGPAPGAVLLEGRD